MSEPNYTVIVKFQKFGFASEKFELYFSFFEFGFLSYYFLAEAESMF